MAKAMGYEIVLIFIHLEWVSLDQARIAQRVAEEVGTVCRTIKY